MSTPLSGIDPDLQKALDGAEAAFAEGLVDEYSSFYADNSLLLIHNQAAIQGKEAIRASFAEVFDGFDTSAYRQTYEIIDVHDRHAYVLSHFEEVLRPRDGKPGIRIHGRLVLFLQRQDDGRWRITMALTGRSAPEEPEE